MSCRKASGYDATKRQHASTNPIVIRAALKRLATALTVLCVSDLLLFYIS
jgi:hypothetical protein